MFASSFSSGQESSWTKAKIRQQNRNLSERIESCRNTWSWLLMDINCRWFRDESISMQIYIYHSALNSNKLIYLSKLFSNSSNTKMPTRTTLCITGKLDWKHQLFHHWQKQFIDSLFTPTLVVVFFSNSKTTFSGCHQKYTTPTWKFIWGSSFLLWIFML